jgi:hypothetical protein
MMFYSIYCTETESIWPTPVGEIRPYFEFWKVRMFDSFLCPSPFTGTFPECLDHIKSHFHGRLEKHGTESNSYESVANWLQSVTSVTSADGSSEPSRHSTRHNPSNTRHRDG